MRLQPAGGCSADNRRLVILGGLGSCVYPTIPEGVCVITNEIIKAVAEVSGGTAMAVPMRFEKKKGYGEMIFTWKPDPKKNVERELIVRGYVNRARQMAVCCRAVLSISGLRRNEPPRRRKVRRNGQGTGLTSGLVVGWCGGTVVSRPAERRVYCCQCENVANASVANVQFYPQVQSPLIGNWNWQWQHFHIGNIRMDRGRVPTDANDLFRDARARAPLLHQVLQLPQNGRICAIHRRAF